GARGGAVPVVLPCGDRAESELAGPADRPSARPTHRLAATGLGRATPLSEIFALPRRIRFADCDPAGIVYFPRFLEMANEIVENWFEARLALTFKDFHFERRWGVPLVNTKVEFLKACRLGETLHLQ